MSQSLPPKPSLVHLRKQAKDLLTALRSGDPETAEGAAKRFSPYFTPSDKVGLVQAQLVLAREYGFESWHALRKHVEGLELTSVDKFIEAVLEGEIDKARSLIRDEGENLLSNPVVAALSGNTEAIRAMLQSDPLLSRSLLDPKKATLLWYACHSWLIQDHDHEQGILDVVEALLRANADPSFFVDSKWGTDNWKDSALYGAAGLLNHAGLTKLLLDAGANPDDGESLYHSCDHPKDNECLRLILEAAPKKESIDFCLIHQLDFENIEGLRLFLDHGADPNVRKPRTALSQAVLRGRSLETLTNLLDAGADPNLPSEDGTTAYALARRLGDREVAALLERYGARAEFQLYDQFLIVAAEGDEARLAQLTEEHPEVLKEFTELGRQPNDGAALGSAGEVLHDLARLGHARGIEILLDFGMDPGLKNERNETALHWACLAGRAEAARVLIEHGAPLDIVETSHNCVPIDWAYWGSEYWSEPFGDYARTVEMVLDLGMPLPKRLQGSEAVRRVLRQRGVKP